MYLHFNLSSLIMFFSLDMFQDIFCLWRQISGSLVGQRFYLEKFYLHCFLDLVLIDLLSFLLFILISLQWFEFWFLFLE